MKKKRRHISSKLTFAERVRRIVKRIPEGKTMSYGEVARKAGAPRAARAVGSVMSHNFDPTVPCHRVVRSDGGVGNYNRPPPMRKMELLMEEAYRAR